MNIKIEVKPGTVKRVLTIAGGLALIGGLVTIAQAVPVTFSNGSVLTAEQLNSNFSDLEARVAVMEAGKATVQSGAFTGSIGDGTWTLNTGTGARNATYHITFATPFATAPTVIASFNYIEANAPLRYTVSVTGVTATGFDLVFGTYYDSTATALGASWHAFAP